MKVKGLALKNTVVALEKLHGKGALERVKEAMPSRLRETVAQVLPLEWYQVEVAAALHTAIRDTLGGGSWKESQRISRQAARVEVTGVYRLILRAVQYDTVWDRMERMWPQYYDAGEARWIDRGHGHARGSSVGWPASTRGCGPPSPGGSRSARDGGRARHGGDRDGAASTHATLEAMWLE